VLVLAVIGFVGFSMIPLISTALKESQPSSVATPATSRTPGAGQQSKIQDAARGYELVLQREPENQTALQGLLEARIQLGDLKGAIAPLEKLAALNPNQTEYTILLAKAKQQLGDQEGAAVAYRAILKTQPGEPQALQGLAGLLLQQNQPEAAIRLLQDTLSTATKANQSQPGSFDVASVRLILGQVYATQKRYDEAIATYDDLIKADKQDFRPVLAKAVVLKQQGKTEQAKPLFENAAALAPAQYKDQIKSVAAQEPAAKTSSPTPAPDSSATPLAPSP
jgi:tetratricopeptide (TPR) repeat protein